LNGGPADPIFGVSTLKMEAGDLSTSLLYIYIPENGNFEGSPIFFLQVS
jgi:hypothetical protein